MAGKIATAVLSLAIVAIGFAWWETPADTKHRILSETGRVLGWSLLVAVVPWAAFALIGWVARWQTNLAGGILVLFFTAAESTVLAWLFAWRIPGATAWVLFTAAVAVAGVYNLFVCDWIAEKLEN